MSTAGAEVAGRPARSRVRLTPRAAALTVVVLVLLLYLVVPSRTYLAQRSRLIQIERQTQVLEQQNAALQRQVRRLRSPAYLEQVARECLGMVKPGEIGFIVVPKSGQVQPPAC